MATIKFYSDKAMEHQVYPDINPDGIYPGVTVGLANNLVSEDGSASTGTFTYRKTGGSTDVSDGYAQLQQLIGNTTSTTIPESLRINVTYIGGITNAHLTRSVWKTQISESGTYEFIYTPIMTHSSSTTESLIYSLNKTTFARYVNEVTADYTFTYKASVSYTDTASVISSFDQSTFITKVNETPGTYTFTYQATTSGDDPVWTLEGEEVTMSDYGITLESTVTEGSAITVSYTSNSWYLGSNSVSLSNYGIVTTGNEKVGDTITISYSSNVWQLNGVTQNLDDYSITLDGTPIVGDVIQIIYQTEQLGVVVIAKPTKLYSIGLNQFDVNGSNILAGYTINSSGVVTASSGSYVIWFRCLGSQTYTIYDSVESSIVRAAYSDVAAATGETGTVLSEQSTATNGQSLTNSTTTKYYEADEAGYMWIATTDIDNLCCHLTLNGTNDSNYETYWDSEYNISYEDANGNTITSYGLPNLGNYYDIMDFTNHRYYKNVDRIEYSSANLTTVKGYNTQYVYDASWIYYGLTETQTYSLPETSNSYQVSNFGTEEFIDTDLDVTATIYYQVNLKDKLRYSVEVTENKTTEITDDSTDTEYPSAKAARNSVVDIYAALGLHVETYSSAETYAVGDYIVHDNVLYKCHTAVTTGAAWDDSTRNVTYETGTAMTALDDTTFAASDLVTEGGLGEYTVCNIIDQGIAYVITPNGRKRYISTGDYGITLGTSTIYTGLYKDTITVKNDNWERSYLFKA